MTPLEEAQAIMKERVDARKALASAKRVAKLKKQASAARQATREDIRKELKAAKCEARRVAKRTKKDALYYKRLKLKRKQTLLLIVSAQKEIYKNLRDADARLKGALDAYDEPRETFGALRYAAGWRDSREALLREQAEQNRNTKDAL